MAKSNKQSYESKWQQAFEEAEVRPAAQLWKNIESDLNAAENAKFKQRLLFYRVVSAAAVACIVVLGVYTWSDEFGKQAADRQKITAVDEQSTSAADNNLSAETETLTERTEELKNINKGNNTSEPAETAPSLAESRQEHKIDPEEKDKISDTPSNTANEIDKADTQTFTPSLAEDRSSFSDTEEGIAQLPGALSSEKTLLAISDKQASIARVDILGIDDNMNTSLNEPVAAIYSIPIMPKYKKDAFQPVFFAGLNLSTDYFNPNYEAPAANAFADQAQFTNANVPLASAYNLGGARTDYIPEGGINATNLGEENTAQLSFSYGANFGVALTKHWSIESGVTYSKYNTSTETFVAYQGIATDEAYPVSIVNNSKENAQQFSSVRYKPAELTNTFDFVAVPLKVGYNLSFNRLGVVFGTGIAANFLLQNNISDDAGQLNEVTIRADENSPFRKVYYSGILSSGIHYQLMEKYSFSITPSYNFSISSLTKSESNFMSQPYTFGIDFGVRYQF